MINLFFSYSHRDADLRDQLEVHLAGLQRQGVISTWHDRRIGAGQEVDPAIDQNLRAADIILLLISPDFIASDYCYNIEMTEALCRHERREARVIPVILRPCDWQDLPFGKLLAIPTDGKPITKFPSLDDGFLEVVKAIKRAAAELSGGQGRGQGTVAAMASPRVVPSEAPVAGATVGPRSSNLRIRKSFTDHERDQFRADAFEYIAKFFENSLTELQARNPGIQTAFRRRDANSFEATIYTSGRQRAHCGIWMGGRRSFGGDIVFSHSGLGDGNSFNESLSISDNGFSLGLKPLGMAQLQTGSSDFLSMEGAAEYYWALLILPLQG